ncbi:MAG TPA: cell division protein DivIVA, partial [Actinobacteria bacterium]|nr:cell division protein DivIVA [Actinomycetota bacterium]
AIAVVAVAVGYGATRSGRMRDDERDLTPADLPEQRWALRADLDRTRFAVGLRGYRMDQVDSVLDRLSRDLDQREAYIAELIRGLEAAGRNIPARPLPQVTEADGDEAAPEPDADA